MTEAIDWLPDEALAAPSLLRALDAYVDAWSAKWFGTRGLGRSDMPVAAVAKPAIQPDWRRFGPGVWLDWAAQTGRRLALHSLGRDDRNSRMTDADRRMLDLLGERIARDLGADLLNLRGGAGAESLRASGDCPVSALIVRLANSSQTFALSLALHRGLLVVARKELCPVFQPAPAEPQPLFTVIRDIAVPFDFALGKATLELRDFEALELGDTVVLDQPLDAPFPLRASATGTTIGQAKLVHEDGRLMLHPQLGSKLERQDDGS